MSNTPTPKEGSLDRMVERVLPNYKKCEANLSSQAEWFDLPITDPPIERVSDDSRSTEGALPNEEELKTQVELLMLKVWNDGAKLAGGTYLKHSSCGMVDAMPQLMHLFREYAKGYAREIIGQDEAPKPDPRSKDVHERLGTCWICYESDNCVHEIRDELRAEQRSKLGEE